MSKPDIALNLALSGLTRRPYPTTRPTFDADTGLDVEAGALTPSAVRAALARDLVRADRSTCHLDAARFQRFDSAAGKRGILISLLDADSSAHLQLFWGLRHIPVLHAVADALHAAFDAKVRLALPADMPASWRSAFDGMRTRWVEPRYPVAHYRLLPHAASYFPVGTVLVLDAVAALDIAFAARWDAANPRRPIALLDTEGTTYRLVDRGAPVDQLTPSTDGAWYAGPRLRDERVARHSVGDGELLFYRDPTTGRFASECVRCGACIDICPTRCDPVALLDASNEDDAGLADRAGLRSCIACGLCTAVCPASIELHHVFVDLQRRLSGGTR